MTSSYPHLTFTHVAQVPASCMGLHIRRASRIVTHLYDEALRPTGLVINQFTILVALYLARSMAVTHLAQELAADQTTLTRNLKLLEKRGLVKMEPGSDRRVRLASLTDKGHEALAQAMPLWEQVQTELQQAFGQQQWQPLLALLSALTALSDG